MKTKMLCIHYAAPVAALLALLSTGCASVPLPTAVVPSPKAIFNDDATVSTNHAVTVRFTLTETTPVRISVQPRDNAAKGFTVKLIDPKSATELAATGATNGRPDFYSVGVSLRQTATLDPGDYVLTIANSENWLNDMTVHVKVTLNPRTEQ